MEKPLKTAATLDGVSTRKDKSYGLRFSTQEMAADVAAEWLKKNGDFGWLLFVPNEVKEIEIPKRDAEAGGKTPSQRLRAVLFKLYQQTQDIRIVDFEAYYKTEMNRIIYHFKSKLDGE